MSGTLLALAPAVALVVHELGHVLAGLALGLPRSAMAVRPGFPVSRVVLRNDLGPVGPWDRTRYRRLLPTARVEFFFTSGGMIVQTLAALVVSVVLALFGNLDRFVGRLVLVSVPLLMGYVVLDALLTRRSGRPQGDASLLWRLSPAATIVTPAAIAAVHVGVLVGLG